MQNNALKRNLSRQVTAKETSTLSANKLDVTTVLPDDLSDLAALWLTIPEAARQSLLALARSLAKPQEGAPDA